MSSRREPPGRCEAQGRRPPGNSRAQPARTRRAARDVCPDGRPRKPYTTGGRLPDDTLPTQDIDLENFARWFADWWLRRGRDLAGQRG
jgi:hypothetical protein